MISHNKGVKVFRCPNTYYYVHIMLGLDDEHPLSVIQLEVELHLLVEDIISSISAEAYEKLCLM